MNFYLLSGVDYGMINITKEFFAKRVGKSRSFLFILKDLCMAESGVLEAKERLGGGVDGKN